MMKMDDNYNESEDNDDTWTPPTEAELKVLQAKRERSDKISHVMGQYLLRGYKMLNSTCSHCATILLEDRDKKLYCVACSEVDNEHAKDNPAVDGIAARRQIQESDHRLLQVEIADDIVPQHEESVPRIATSRGNEDLCLTGSDVPRWLEKAETQLRRTLETTTDELSRAQGIEERIRYCTLIKTSAEALIALKSLKNASN